MVFKPKKDLVFFKTNLDSPWQEWRRLDRLHQVLTCLEMVHNMRTNGLKKSRGQPAKLKVTWKMATEIVCVCVCVYWTCNQQVTGSAPGHSIAGQRPWGSRSHASTAALKLQQYVNSYRYLILSLPRFNGHFPGEPGLAGVY